MSESNNISVRDHIESVVKEFNSRLSEFSDSVLVLVSYRDDEGDTVSYNWTGGNFYASHGLAEEWLSAQRSRIDKHVKHEDE